MIAHKRTFGGKVYGLYRVKDYLRDARVVAENIRKRGFNARVVSVSLLDKHRLPFEQHVVYVRGKCPACGTPWAADHTTCPKCLHQPKRSTGHKVGR